MDIINLSFGAVIFLFASFFFLIISMVRDRSERKVWNVLAIGNLIVAMIFLIIMVVK